MATEVRIPRAGEKGFRARVTEWFVKEGDIVKKGMPMLQVVGDGVTMEVEAPEDGQLQLIRVPSGQQVMTGISVGTISRYVVDGRPADGNTNEAIFRISGTEENGAASEIEEPPVATAEPQREEPQEVPPPAEAEAETEKEESSTHSIAWYDESYFDEEYTQFNNKHAADQDLSVTEPVHQPNGRRPNEWESKTETVQIGGDTGLAQYSWISTEVDLTGVQACSQARAELNDSSVLLNRIALFVNAVSNVLRNYPQLNATWQDGRASQNNRINLLLGVYKQDVRLVTKVENADRRSFKELLAAGAGMSGERSLSPERSKSCTFTLNVRSATRCNLGGDRINYPQVATLTLDAVTKRPVVVSRGDDDMITVRPIMSMSLTFDVRVVDSVSATKFIQEIRSRIESFSTKTAID